MAEPSLLNAAVTIAFGAIAGGTTNAVAIWMLFHPYEPQGIARFKLQGAIPKNKARLAKTIGRTVGQRLLTAEDLAGHLSSPELRAAFDNAVSGLVSAVLETERGSLRSELPPAILAEIETAISRVAPAIADRIVDYARQDEFRNSVEKFLDRARDEFSDKTVGEVITEDRRAAIKQKVDDWLGSVTSSADFENAIGNWLDRQTVHLASDNTPLLERFPEGLLAAVEESLAGYLPEALDRLAGLLGNEESRQRIQAALHDLFTSFAENLLVHERIVARLVMTEKTIARVLDTFERTGADRVADLLDQPEMRSQVAKTINQALVSFLRRPMAEHIAALGASRVENIKETAQKYLVAALGDERTRQYITERVDTSLKKLESKPLSELLDYLPAERAAKLMSDGLTAPLTRSWIEEALRSALLSMLDQPIGRPADWLGKQQVNGITPGLSPTLWHWTQTQVPKIVEQIDVAGMVEEKVLGFSLERIEHLVRATTQRELDVIIRLGYVLGGIVGLTAYAVTLLLP